MRPTLNAHAVKKCTFVDFFTLSRERMFFLA
jgi:hypothetical protein